MNYLVAVTAVHPLTLHFSLHNDSTAACFVPRLLTPPGAFLRATISDAAGTQVYRSSAPKVKLKLDPSREASYLELEAGYSYGAALVLDDALLPPGQYRLELAYSNAPFLGTPGTPVGVLSWHTRLPLNVPTP